MFVSKHYQNPNLTRYYLSFHGILIFAVIFELKKIGLKLESYSLFLQKKK